MPADHPQLNLKALRQAPVCCVKLSEDYNPNDYPKIKREASEFRMVQAGEEVDLPEYREIPKGLVREFISAEDAYKRTYDLVSAPEASSGCTVS